jgi:hypothetical protein
VKWLKRMRSEVPPDALTVVDHVWRRRHVFIRWPHRGDCWWSGCVRIRFHKYTTKQRKELAAAQIKADVRSNGPAVMAFLLSGGERPSRRSPGRQWSVHHIYDGKWPAPGRPVTAHAVKNKRLFTHSAGLVAVHPLADALADEVPYFAWLLRLEAYKRFQFDPDGVFAPSELPNTTRKPTSGAPTSKVKRRGTGRRSRLSV